MNRLVAVVGATVIAVACSQAEGEAGNGDDVDQADVNVRVVNVEAQPVLLGEFTGFIRVTGEVEAIRDATVSAEESGRVHEFLTEKGAWVEQGQALVKLEDDLLLAQTEEARASAQLAREEWERQRQLWEVDSVGTELMYLQRKYQAEIATARLEQLESRLDRTVVRAPVAGVFDDYFLEVGEMAIPGAPVVRVVDISRVKITAGVPERYVRSVTRGDAAIVTFDIFPGREFQGRVRFVGTSVDPSNRTFEIEILLNNPQGMMKPAMVANVQVQRERLESVIAVPQDVVLRSADGYKVFVIEDRDGYHIAKARTVVLGPAAGNTVVIEEGLERGDLLITLGQQLVDDESRVRLVNEIAASRTEAREN
jgi:RND family efflux transporter MFP subunit